MHHLIQGCSFLCGGRFECSAIVFVPDEIQQLFNCHLIPGLVKEWVEQTIGHFLSNFAYRISANSFRPWIVSAVFRRLMKGKFDSYVLWPLVKMVQNLIVDQSTVQNFTTCFENHISWKCGLFFENMQEWKPRGPLKSAGAKKPGCVRVFEQIFKFLV